MGGHKKLSDCFIDAGVPRLLRPDALLLTRTRGADEQILWVGGLARSEAFRVDADTERVLYLELTRSCRGAAEQD